jgi:hypothetical protein
MPVLKLLSSPHFLSPFARPIILDEENKRKGRKRAPRKGRYDVQKFPIENALRPLRFSFASFAFIWIAL